MCEGQGLALSKDPGDGPDCQGHHQEEDNWVRCSGHFKVHSIVLT